MKLMMATADGPKEVSTDELFKGKKVVMFAVPGAFTPTCSAKHLPGFVQNAEAIKAKGVDSVVCMAVNDAFVMGAWGKDQGAGDKVLMLADGSAALTKALGLELDLIARGLGVRSQRYALVAEDGKVTHLGRRGARRLRGQQGRVDSRRDLIANEATWTDVGGGRRAAPSAPCCKRAASRDRPGGGRHTWRHGRVLCRSDLDTRS